MTIGNFSELTNNSVIKQIPNKTLTIGNWIKEVISNAPGEINSKLATLITILQVAGIIFIAYIIFLIIRTFLTWRRHKKIDKTYEIVQEIDKKIDILLSHHEEYKELLTKNSQKRLEKKVKKTEKNSKSSSKIISFFRNLFKKIFRKKENPKI